MSTKLSNEKVLQLFKDTHQDYYSYKLVDYKRADKNVTIICPKHGSFEQRPCHHIRGSGCKKCAYEKNANSRRASGEKVIEGFKAIHGEKYDYSKVKYKSTHAKVIIICPIHGDFKQSPAMHKSGQDCFKCGVLKRAKNTTSTTVEWIKEARIAHGNRYDYSRSIYEHNTKPVIIICKTHGEFMQKPGAHKRGAGCHQCSFVDASDRNFDGIEGFLKKALNVHGDTYDYSRVKYIHSKMDVEIICPSHGSFLQRPNNHVAQEHGCPKCTTRVSKGETEVAEFIAQYATIETSDRTQIKPFELDIFLPEKSIAIEYNGVYWHSEKFLEKNKHINKTKMCNESGIDLIQIWDFEWNEKQEIVKSLILARLGKSPHKIAGRKTTAVDVTPKDANAFFVETHMKGRTKANKYIGLEYNGELVGCAAFKSDGYLCRLSFKLNTTIMGGFNKLIKAWGGDVFSYVDLRLFSGESYKRAGFEHGGDTAPGYFYHKRNGGIYSRQQCQKKRLTDLLDNFDPDLTEVQNCNNNDMFRVFDCGNARYELKA